VTAYLRQTEVEALHITAMTTAEHVRKFDRDFRLAAWMVEANGWLVKSPSGEIRWVNESHFHEEHVPIPPRPRLRVVRLPDAGFAAIVDRFPEEWVTENISAQLAGVKEQLGARGVLIFETEVELDFPDVIDGLDHFLAGVTP
jgi:hypothetical protein